MKVVENGLGLDVAYIKLSKEYVMADDKPIRSPEDAVNAVAEVLKDLDREVVVVVTMKTNGSPINCSFVSVGTLNNSLVCPREVMKTAILSNAASIMLFHNHPSGGALPSIDDIRITDRISQACTLMGIELMDHIIIGAASKEWFSFKAKGFVESKNIIYQNNIEDLNIKPDPKNIIKDHKDEINKAAEELNIYKSKRSR